MARPKPCKLPPPPVLSPYDGKEKFVREWEQWFQAVHAAICDVEPPVVIQPSGPTQIQNIFMDGGDGVAEGDVIYQIQAAAAVATAAYVYGWIFGDGSDGTVNFDGTNTFTNFATTTGSSPNRIYTLTRPVWAADCTVSAGKTVFVPNQQIFCTGTLTNAGLIDASGSNNTVNQGTGQPGAGIGANGVYAGGNNSGSAGNGVGVPAAGTSSTNNSSIGGSGGAGGTSSSGQAGAAGGTATVTSLATVGGVHLAAHLLWMLSGKVINLAAVTQFCGGAGGGGGGGVPSVCSGGGGGSAGGIAGIFARFISGAGQLFAKGGDGNPGNWQAAGGGGGGGGGGGAILAATTSAIGWASTMSVSVAGGAAGTPSGGTAAVAGTAGNFFNIVLA